MCVCEFIFVMLHKLYCAASTFPPLPRATPSYCYCCSLARRIHCKLLFLLIFAHIFISILFLALANELCAMQQAVPELGVVASPHSPSLSVCATFVASCESSARRLSFTRLTRSHHSPPPSLGVPLLTLDTGVA